MAQGGSGTPQGPGNAALPHERPHNRTPARCPAGSASGTRAGTSWGLPARRSGPAPPRGSRCTAACHPGAPRA
eukprot:15180502-Heterocapsa_arctica.AAC.1